MKKYSKEIATIITIVLGFTVLSVNSVASSKVESELDFSIQQNKCELCTLLEQQRIDKGMFKNKRNRQPRSRVVGLQSAQRKHPRRPNLRRGQVMNFRGLELTEEQKVEIDEIKQSFRKEIKVLYTTRKENMMGVLTSAQQDTMRTRLEKFHSRRKTSRF